MNIKEIALKYVSDYEKNPDDISIYYFYTLLRRELNNEALVKRFQPLKKEPIQIKNYGFKSVKYLNENHKSYFIEERDYYSKEIIIQYIVKVWNRNLNSKNKFYNLSQFEITQVIYGSRFKNRFEDDTCDTSLTFLMDYDVDNIYSNIYNIYEVSEDEIENLIKDIK